MLEPLYEKTVERKNEINSFFSNLQNEINIHKVKKTYHEHEFTKEKQDKIFAAIDGSFNKTKFMACFVYAISSQAIVSKPDDGISKESATGDINIISTTKSRTIDNILSTHMNIIELKSTIDTLQRFPEIDYMLIDGSLRGTLRNFPTNSELSDKIIRELNNKTKKLEEKLDKGNFPLEVTTITQKNDILYTVENILKINNDDTDIKEIEDEVLRYYESLEQLTCINYLLKHFNNKIICISKTSSTKSIFNENIPDAAVIEYTCENPGYTEIIPQDNNLIRTKENKTVLIKYPVYNSDFKDYKYSIFYTKLSKKSNVLKIEVPYEINPHNYRKVESILNDLYSTSIDGYPYILKKAHNEVVIKNKDMQNIINRLEVIEKTGRDMLN